MKRLIQRTERILALVILLVMSQATYPVAQGQFQYRQQITKENGLPGDAFQVTTQDRIEILNALYNTTTHVKIIDLFNKEGKARCTSIELNIPT